MFPVFESGHDDDDDDDRLLEWNGVIELSLTDDRVCVLRKYLFGRSSAEAFHNECIFYLIVIFGSRCLNIFLNYYKIEISVKLSDRNVNSENG